MLVLSRSTSVGKNSINLELPDGSTMRVVVVRVQGENVRLGFEAPRGVTILRSELSVKDHADAAA